MFEVARVSANAPAWLTARPIAHRGLHDAAKGVVENTLGAARSGDRAAASPSNATSSSAATARRWCSTTTRSAASRAARGADRREDAPPRSRRRRFATAASAIPTLPQLLARIAGRTPLICELKSRFDGDMRLADRVAALGARLRRAAGVQELRSRPDRPFARAPRRRSRRSASSPRRAIEGWHWRALNGRAEGALRRIPALSRDAPGFSVLARRRPAAPDAVPAARTPWRCRS